MAERDEAPHPVTGQPFGSPVRPGAGWPGDPAAPRTPRARTPDDVAQLAGSARTLAQLDARVTTCRACPRLVEWREHVATTKRASFADQPYWGRPVAGWGDEAPHTLVVGLAPAANGANRTGRIFTGDRSGDFLFAALHRVGLANQPTSRHAGDGLALVGVRITAPVHCAPPANAPTTIEKATCAPWLEQELALVEPTLTTVLALGGIGWAQLLSTVRGLGWAVPRPLPRFTHGAQITLFTPAGKPIRLLGCYHVSQQNTFTGTLTPDMIDEVLRRLTPDGFPLPRYGHQRPSPPCAAPTMGP